MTAFERLSRGIELLREGFAERAFHELRGVDLQSLTDDQRIVWAKESVAALEKAGRHEDAEKFLTLISPLIQEFKLKKISC